MDKKQDSIQVLCLKMVLKHIVAHGKATKQVGLLLQDGKGNPSGYVKWDKQQ